MRNAIAVAVVVSLTAPAAAQPSSALGKPLLTTDLPDGTVVVRVLDGDIASPVIGVTAKLTVDGVERFAVTDKTGRATFEHVRSGAHVIARSGKAEASDDFVVPPSGGVRVMLTVAPWREDLGVPPRGSAVSTVHPRGLDAGATVDDAIAPGTLAVHLTYDDLADVKPPAGVAVSLVGYNADDSIAASSATTDALGVATFTKLDVTGATAYVAMAMLPRNGKIDRLVARPTTFDAKAGQRLILSADRRDARTPAVDDLDKLEKQERVPAGRVRVKLEGVPGEEVAEIEVVDAATGNVVAHATRTAKAQQVEIRVTPSRGEVIYAQATLHATRYRSLPFIALESTGTKVSLYVYPRTLATYSLKLDPIDPVLDVQMLIKLANNAWAPKRIDDDLPLPKGFAKVEVGNDSGLGVVATPSGLHLARPVPPGGATIAVLFELPAVGGQAAFSLDLPFGSYQSGIELQQLAGVKLDTPTSIPVRTVPSQGGLWLVASDITILPKQAMVFTVEMPRLSPRDSACARLHPDPTSPLLGKRAPELVARQLDGSGFRLAFVRGALAIVTFDASWCGPAEAHRSQLATLASAVPGLVPVTVFSDGDAKVVRKELGRSVPNVVVLDPPVGESNIGPITTTWGTNLLPESYVIDRKGIVRYYFANSRDWDSPEAIACLAGLAAE